LEIERKSGKIGCEEVEEAKYKKKKDKKTQRDTQKKQKKTHTQPQNEKSTCEQQAETDDPTKT
jgi:hypothetical protein